MKKILFLLLLAGSASLLAQEEFFQKQYGISVGYLYGFHPEVKPIMATALSVHLKNGLVLGGQYDKVHYQPFGSVSVLYIVQSESANDPALALGISYSKIYGYDFAAVHSTVYKCFFTDSNFPFSISAGASVQLEIPLETGTVPVITVGLGYTQAFFAKHRVYPFIGTSLTVQQETEMLTTVIGGLNIRLSKAE